MLEVAAARQTVLRFTARLEPAVTGLTPAALGRVLVEDVRADRACPPFAKAPLDGVALRSADCPGPAELRVIEEVPAGAVPTKSVGPGEAMAIFTGAPMPDGADAIVMIERTEPLPGGRVRVAVGVKPGQNVLPRGREMTAGDVVLPAGT